MLIQITIEIVDEVRLLPNAIFPVSGRRDNGERQTGERRVDQEQSRMYPKLVM